MFKISALIFSSLLMLASAAFAQTHAAHEHGVATMDLSIEADGFVVGFDSPLANFISFEHEPATEPQKAEVNDMVNKLAKAEELFKAPAEAKCVAKTISLSSSNIPPELFGQYASNGGPGHSHGHEGEESQGIAHGHEGEESQGITHGQEGEGAEHGDLEALYDFECGDTSKLVSLEVGLFAVFPSLEEVEARVVSDKGQSAHELTASGFQIRW
jgi:hypothetical protein